MAKLTKKKITKTLLKKAAEDLNALDITDLPIPIEGKFEDKEGKERDVTKKTLEKDVFEVGSILETDEIDRLQEQTREILVLLEAIGGPDPDLTEETEVVGEESTKNETAEETEPESVEPEAVENEEPEPEPAKEEGNDTPEPEPKKKKRGPKKGYKKNTYGRVHAFCDALKGKPKTSTELAEKAEKLYCKKNPNRKPAKISYVEWSINRYYLDPLVILGVVVFEDGKYSIKD